MIVLQKINKIYYLGSQSVKVLDNISLEIEEKDFLGILGASGSGKSTLMHIIGLLDKPTNGKVLIDGQDTTTLNDNQISSLRNEYMGFVFQQFNLIEKLTVLENVLLPVSYTTKGSREFFKKEAEELLRRLGIYDRKDYFPNQISGGQQQRVAIARALLLHPKVVLADEPTGNLDSKTGAEILALLSELNKDLGISLVIVTHDQEIAKRSKRKIIIKDGKIL